MLLAEDGQYAYIHAGQEELVADEMFYIIQPATDDSLRCLDRCRRGVMRHDPVVPTNKVEAGRAAETTQKEKPADEKVAGFLKKELGKVCCCTHFPAFGIADFIAEIDRRRCRSWAV